MQTTTTKPTVATVRETCKGWGVSFRRDSQTKEFVIGGSYFTDDADDAIRTAKMMAQQRQQRHSADNYPLSQELTDYAHKSGRAIVPDSLEFKFNPESKRWPLSALYRVKDGGRVAFDYDVQCHSWTLSAD